MKSLGACLTIVAVVFAANFTFGCGSMEETAPGVFEGTGRYEGKTYREAEPGESPDAYGRSTANPASGFNGGFLGRGFNSTVTGYVELTPSELASLQNEGTDPAAPGAQVQGPPPPPPMFRVSPSRLKMTSELVEPALPEKAAEQVEDEELILA